MGIFRKAAEAPGNAAENHRSRKNITEAAKGTSYDDAGQARCGCGATMMHTGMGYKCDGCHPPGTFIPEDKIGG